MAIGKNLLKEKTNVGVKGTTTFNAPGNYKAPYGKTTVTLGGRGASGNPGNPGNPTVPGNHVPGNYVPGNPHSHRSIYSQYSLDLQAPVLVVETGLLLEAVTAHGLTLQHIHTGVKAYIK